MKRNVSISVIIFLVAFCFSFQVLNAQEKTKEEKEKELRIREAIDAQKKAMTEKHRVDQEALLKAEKEIEVEERATALDDAMREVIIDEEDRKDIDDAIEKAHRIYRDFRIDKVFPDGESYIFPGPHGEFIYTPFNNSASRTSWSFSKSIKESTFSREYIIDVDLDVKSVVMSVNGDCKSGEVRIKIIMPGGKVYSDILIDEFGDLNWRKSFMISDTENKDKTGSWKFEINSSKASGFFNITLQTS